jgi:hypothetical protein
MGKAVECDVGSDGVEFHLSSEDVAHVSRRLSGRISMGTSLEHRSWVRVRTKRKTSSERDGGQ